MRDIAFEEENIGLPTIVTIVVIDDDRVIVPNTIRIANPRRVVNQDINVLPTTQMEGSYPQVKVSPHMNHLK